MFGRFFLGELWDSFSKMVASGRSRWHDGLNILSTDSTTASTPLALHDRCSHDMSMQLRLNS